MRRLFKRVREGKEEGTLFGTLDHWVEIKASTIYRWNAFWFLSGNAAMFAFLYLVVGVLKAV